MKESQVLVVMETKDMNKVNIKAEYLTKSCRVNFLKKSMISSISDFFLEHHLRYVMGGIRHANEANSLKIAFISLAHDSRVARLSFVGVLIFKMLHRLYL